MRITLVLAFLSFVILTGCSKDCPERTVPEGMQEFDLVLEGGRACVFGEETETNLSVQYAGMDSDEVSLLYLAHLTAAGWGADPIMATASTDEEYPTSYLINADGTLRMTVRVSDANPFHKPIAEVDVDPAR